MLWKILFVYRESFIHNQQYVKKLTYLNLWMLLQVYMLSRDVVFNEYFDFFCIHTHIWLLCNINIIRRYVSWYLWLAFGFTIILTNNLSSLTCLLFIYMLAVSKLRSFATTSSSFACKIKYIMGHRPFDKFDAKEYSEQ